jgi:hypothetical protein
VGEKRQIGGDKKSRAAEKSAWELIKLHFSGGNEIIVRRSDWTRAHQDSNLLHSAAMGELCA